VKPLAVRVESLEKRYPRRARWGDLLRPGRPAETTTALDGVSLHVAAGECYGLLGENGAGKTTLFRILATLVLPDGGRAAVGDADVVARPADVRRRVAHVPTSERSLHWRLDARENLELYAALYGVPAADAGPRITELLALVGLERAGAEPAGAFSTGMRQRLLLARALLAQPAVLLLDEPTRGLDPVGARDFRRFLRDRVLGPAGCTALVATHAPEEVREVCDRVGVLHRGRLVAQGTAAELAARVAVPRYRLVTGAPPAAALGGLDGAVRVAPGAPRALEDGWWAVEIEVPGGAAALAAAVAALVRADVPVGGLERVEIPLPEVLERVVRDA
jgi:ABC-2 type transport system ATP-binding protein